jgi:uncharacterized protein (TIGR02217 family)
MTATARVSSTGLEVLSQDEAARVSQVGLEVLESVRIARVSQAGLEVLEQAAQLRVSQVGLEVLETQPAAAVELPRLPDALAYGAVGGPQFLTQVVMTQSGAEQRNQCWAQARAAFEIGYTNRDDAETRTLIAFFSAVALGRAGRFRVHDFLPGEDTGTDEPLGTGDGATRVFQLLKRYTYAGYSDDRVITRPRAGSVTCALDGVPTTAFTVDTTTGRLTFTLPPGNGVAVTASFTFDVPCRFDTDQLPLQRTAPNAWTWDRLTLWEVRETTRPLEATTPGFREVALPPSFAYGAQGGAMFSTTIAGAPSGFEAPQVNWTLARGEWELGFLNRTDAETAELIAFFRAIGTGQLNGFRFRDFQPGEDTGTHEVLGVGDGTTTTFQLVKWYVEQNVQYQRVITKPIAGTVEVAVNGVPTSAFTVDTTTGLVTMDSTPDPGVVVDASFLFEVPVRFAQDRLELTRVGPNAVSWSSVKLVEIRDFL